MGPTQRGNSVTGVHAGELLTGLRRTRKSAHYAVHKSIDLLRTQLASEGRHASLCTIGHRIQ